MILVLWDKAAVVLKPSQIKAQWMCSDRGLQMNQILKPDAVRSLLT